MNQLERQSFTSRVHHQRIALFDVPSQELLGQRILQVFLHGTAHGSSAVGWIVSGDGFLHEHALGCVECQRDPFMMQIVRRTPGGSCGGRTRITENGERRHESLDLFLHRLMAGVSGITTFILFSFSREERPTARAISRQALVPQCEEAYLHIKVV